jgi:hypothetical protein
MVVVGQKIKEPPQVGQRIGVSLEQEQMSALRLIENKANEYVNEAVEPVKTFAKTYQAERLHGRALVARGISAEKQSVWERAKNIGLGTLQYTFSPWTAASKTVGKELVKEPLKAVGVPEGYAEFAGKLGEEAVWFVPVGQTIRSVMVAGKPALKASIEMEKIAKSLTKTATKENIGRKLIDDADLKLSRGDELTQPIMKESLAQELVEPAVKVLKEAKLEKGERLFRQIGEKIAVGEIDFPHMAEIAEKLNLTKPEMAKIFESAGSFGGRWLGRLSHIRKQLNKTFKDNPEALSALDEFYATREQAPYLIDKAMGAISSGVNFWRASLVSQVATSMRNAWSQAGRLTISAFDESLQAGISKVFGGEGRFAGPNIVPATINEIRRDFNKVMSVFRSMKPKETNKLLKVLDENHAIIEKSRLFSQPVHEVTLGKIAKVLNTLNRTQEFFFRRIAFEAKARQLLKQRGLNFNTIDPKHIPNNLLEESVNYALEMTFAASPKSKSVQKFVNAWTNSPLVLVNPFPRFNFANAIPFMFEHSPLGYLNAVRPSTIKALASGDVRQFAKAASRATTGSLALNAAMNLRQSEHAGERWYEIKAGDKYIDTRPYAPISTYLFLAEAFTHPERIKPSDWLKMTVGLNRVAGTGLVATDWLRAKTGESLKRQAMNFFGQHLAGYTTPSRSISDFYGALDPEESVYRDYRESPLIGPTLLNLPRLSQYVPEKPSPVKSGRIRKGENVKIGKATIPAGVFRQLTGFSTRTKTLVEKEIDKRGVEWGSIVPKTGIPEADRKMSRYMAPVVEALAPRLIKDNDNYGKLSEEGKRIALVEMFKLAKEQARRELAVNDPALALRVRVKSKSRDAQTIINRKLIGRKVR